MLTLAADTILELSRPTPSSEVVGYKTKDFLKTVEVIHITSSMFTPLSPRQQGISIVLHQTQRN